MSSVTPAIVFYCKQFARLCYGKPAPSLFPLVNMSEKFIPQKEWNELATVFKKSKCKVADDNPPKSEEGEAIDEEIDNQPS